MVDVNDTLKERGSRYGDFATHAQITQDMKAVMQDTPKWKALSASMKEALEMVAHKIGRILNGDPSYADSWHDIAGYSKLVEDELSAEAPTHVVDIEVRDATNNPVTIIRELSPSAVAAGYAAKLPLVAAVKDAQEGDVVAATTTDVVPVPAAPVAPPTPPSPFDAVDDIQ